ncbi:MAG: metal ABC transporter permease [Nitrospirae bacterium]|nr:metal ABC transporter permease [Nitrospirota bacterium]
MLEMLSIPFMRQAVLASLILAAMLAYLGIHVVRRRIVFVDLAIAQLSAVGVALAMLLDQDPIGFSLVFTMVGAAFLSLPAYEQRIPQEAIMGIVYAVASAVSILIIAKMPHGEADILNLFFGNILAVTDGQIGLMALTFGSVGLVHLIFAKRLIPIPTEPGSSFLLRAMSWNLLFYLTLAVVIAVAIRTAGVLLVFSDLVIPAAVSLLFAERLRSLVLLSAVTGVLSNLAGLYASYRFDLPSGPSIVASLGVFLALAMIGKSVALTIFSRSGRSGPK